MDLEKEIKCIIGGLSPSKVRVWRTMIGQISSSRLLGRLGRRSAPFRSLLEAIDRELSFYSSDATWCLEDLNTVLDGEPSQLLDEVSAVARSSGGSGNPEAAWNALVTRVALEDTRRGLLKAAKLIEAGHPVSDVEAAFSDIPPPPTAKAQVSEDRDLRTADKLVEKARSGSAVGGSPVRFSSGYPTLDAALTGEGEPLGVVAPGEFLLFLGATGTGKSSMEYAIQRASTLDMVRMLPDALSLLLHTEESSVDKARAIGLAPGQRWAALARNIVIENVGSSRRRVAEVFYDAIAHAVRRADREGRDLAEFLPYKVHLDYIQALVERGEGDNQAVVATSELILRGLQACNPDEIEKFTGVNFSKRTGMRWPEEIDGHQVAVIGYAQLRKSDAGQSLFYDPANPRMSVFQFTLEGPGGEPAWDVKAGDFRLFTKEDIYGSSKPLQNATNVVLLHRSRPVSNPAVPGPDGRLHLQDRRARLILDKARTGQFALYVPMEFDVDQSGFRAQYYDPIGWEQRDLPIEWSLCEEYGDPMVPVHPIVRSPFDGVKY